MAKSNDRHVRRHRLLHEIVVSYEGDGEQVPVHLPDISTHGMFINTPRYLPVGAVLKLHFRLLLSGVDVFARAEVRHCIPGLGVGVEFIELSPEAERAIREEIKIAYPANRAAFNAPKRTGRDESDSGSDNTMESGLPVKPVKRDAIENRNLPFARPTRRPRHR